MSTLHRKAEKVLLALVELGGEANTAEIRKETGLSSALIGHHTSNLREWGLIERVGREDVGAPMNANVYGLTAEGEDQAAAIESAPAHDAVLDRVDHVEGEISRLEEQLAVRDERIESLEERVELLQESLQRVLEALDEGEVPQSEMG